MAKKQFNVHTELTAKIDDLTSKLNTAQKRVDYFKNKNKKSSSSDDIFNSLTASAAKFLPAIGAATAAQQVFQGTIKTTQTAGDAWDITYSGMQGTLEGFYRTIGSGDWNNFINNLVESGEAAKELTAALDELGEIAISAKLNNSQIDVEIAKLNKELRIANALGDNKLVLELEAELTAKADEKYSNNLKVAEDTLKAYADNISAITKLSFEDIKTFLSNYNSETSDKIRSEIDKYNNTISEYESNINSFQMALANSSYSSEYKNQIREDKRLAEEKLAIFRDSLSDEAKIYLASLEAYNRTNDEKIQGAINAQLQISQLEVGRINETSRAEVTAATVKKRLNDAEIKQLQEKLNLLAKTAPKELSIGDYQVEEFGLAPIKYGGLKGLTDELNELRRVQELAASPEIWQEYQAQITSLEEQINNFKGVNIENNDLLLDQMNKEIQLIDSLSNGFGNLAMMANNFGNTSLGAMLNSIGGMLQAIQVVRQLQAAKAAEAITNATVEGTKIPFPASLVAIATGVSAVLSVLSSIPKFSVGGVVGGSSFTGDKILAGLNSGERVLTVEQNKIFDKLVANNGGIGGEVNFRIEGDALEGVLNKRNRNRASYV